MSRRRLSPKVKLKPESVWELLEQRGMSQNELARQCGITSGHLSHLMNGKRSPSPQVRRRLQQVLGVINFDDLFVIVPQEVHDGTPE